MHIRLKGVKKRHSYFRFVKVEWKLKSSWGIYSEGEFHYSAERSLFSRTQFRWSNFYDIFFHSIFHDIKFIASLIDISPIAKGASYHCILCSSHENGNSIAERRECPERSASTWYSLISFLLQGSCFSPKSQSLQELCFQCDIFQRKMPRCGKFPMKFKFCVTNPLD